MSFSNVMVLLFDLSYIGITKVLISTVLVCYILPILLGLTQRSECKTSNIVPNTWIGGVIQDGFSASLVQLLLIGIPFFYIELIDIGRGISGWIAIFYLILVAMRVVGFFINNNVKHVEAQRGVLEYHPEEKGQWDILRESLIRQNCITMFMTLPYFMMRLICDTAGLIIRKRDFDDDNRIYRQLIAEYVDFQKYRETYEGMDGKLHYCFEVEKTIMSLGDIADCTVTKLNMRNDDDNQYIAIFLLPMRDKPTEALIADICKNVPAIIGDKRWVICKSERTIYKGEKSRNFEALKSCSKDLYDLQGQMI